MLNVIFIMVLTELMYILPCVLGTLETSYHFNVISDITTDEVQNRSIFRR